MHSLLNISEKFLALRYLKVRESRPSGEKGGDKDRDKSYKCKMVLTSGPSKCNNCEGLGYKPHWANQRSRYSSNQSWVASTDKS